MTYCNSIKLSDGGTGLNTAPHWSQYCTRNMCLSSRSESSVNETSLCFQQTPPPASVTLMKLLNST